jgi:hypothetical protein
MHAALHRTVVVHNALVLSRFCEALVITASKAHDARAQAVQMTACSGVPPDVANCSYAPVTHRTNETYLNRSKDFRSNLVVLLEKHPELLRAVNEQYTAKKTYETERKRRSIFGRR